MRFAHISIDRVTSLERVPVDPDAATVTGSTNHAAIVHPRADRILGPPLRTIFSALLAKRNPAYKKNPSRQDLYFGRIIEAFAQGCLGALQTGLCQSLIQNLNSLDDKFRGFSFEGAAMGLSLMDFCSGWRRNRLEEFIAQTHQRHIYMSYIGLGWTLACCRISISRILRFSDPLLGWLILDGCGFYYGFFHQKGCILRRQIPPRFSIGYTSRAFDQGLGRSLWFNHQGDVAKIANTISSFSLRRRADLWSGIGLACSYAGGIEVKSLELLTAVARGFRCELAQGAAFAAQARRRARTPASHTTIACETLCNMSAEEAAIVTDACLEAPFPEGGEPAYEVWRGRIRERFR